MWVCVAGPAPWPVLPITSPRPVLVPWQGAGSLARDVMPSWSGKWGPSPTMLGGWGMATGPI